MEFNYDESKQEVEETILLLEKFVHTAHGTLRELENQKMSAVMLRAEYDSNIRVLFKGVFKLLEEIREIAKKNFCEDSETVLKSYNELTNTIAAKNVSLNDAELIINEICSVGNSSPSEGLFLFLENKAFLQSLFIDDISTSSSDSFSIEPIRDKSKTIKENFFRYFQLVENHLKRAEKLCDDFAKYEELQDTEKSNEVTNLSDISIQVRENDFGWTAFFLRKDQSHDIWQHRRVTIVPPHLYVFDNDEFESRVFLGSIVALSFKDKKATANGQLALREYNGFEVCEYDDNNEFCGFYLFGDASDKVVSKWVNELNRLSQKYAKA